jgi:cell pole-organizing protein PopZ
MLSAKVNDNNRGEEKLEDVLRSIRNLIDERNPSEVKQQKETPSKFDADDNILELTTEFRENTKNNDDTNSNQNANKSSAIIKGFTKKLDTQSYQSDNKLETVLNELVKPLLKEWMDKNLPQLVEKVVEEEFGKLLPKK